MKTQTDIEKTWAELDALKARLNRETIAKRQGNVLPVTRDDKFIARAFGGRVCVFVDSKGKPMF